MLYADRTEDGLRSSPVLRRHSWSREVVRISPPSPGTATPFAAGGRPPWASPGHHEAGLMLSPSLPVPSIDKAPHFATLAGSCFAARRLSLMPYTG